MENRGRGFVNYGAVDPVSVAVVDSNFNPREFSTICENIGSDVYLIQSNATNLEKIQKQIGTPSDNASLRDKIHVLQQRSNQKINSTTEYVRQITILSRLGEKHHRMQAERLRNELHSAVQRYSNVQKQVATKIKSIFLRPVQTNLELTSPSESWSVEDSDQTQLLDTIAAQQQAQRQLATDLEVEQAFALERDERIRQIEADTLDVQDVFRKLAEIVKEQGTLINDIDSNIERAGVDVEAGEGQLIQASSYQRKYRTKLCCLLGILFTVAVVIIIVVVLVKYT